MGREIGAFRSGADLPRVGEIDKLSAQRFSAARSIRYIVTLPGMDVLIGESSDVEYHRLVRAIRIGNKQAVLDWRNRMTEDKMLGEKSWRALMADARQLGVRCYSRMSKRELINAIDRRTTHHSSEEAGADQ